MRLRTLLPPVLLALAVFLALHADISGQTSMPAAIVAQVPPEDRPQVEGLMVLEPAARRAVVDGWVRNRRIDLAPALAFLLAHDPSRERRLEIVEDVLPPWPALGRREEMRAALERVAVDDPDVRMALAALEALRLVRVQDTRALLRQRLERAVLAKRENEAAELAVEDDRWVGLETGSPLPTFLRTPPPLFSVTAQPRIRVAVIGDFGNGSRQQRDVARALLALHRQEPFDFGITLGDNFYNQGLSDPADVRWKTWWEDLYGPLGVPFFASLGNHDWAHPDSPAVEMLYAWKSASWRLPSLYYSYLAGPVQFFATNTQHLSAGQLSWLDRGLSRSLARWQIVYGHHPPAFPTVASAETAPLDRALLPLLQGRADVYFGGHIHELAHFVTGPLNVFVSAGAGEVDERRPPTKGALFSAHHPGFAVLEANYQALTIRFFDVTLTELYHVTLKK